MKKAREMEFRVQCRKHKGAPVLGEDQAIAEITFRAIEGTTAESFTGAEEEIFAMGRAGFCAAARGPIKSWWYQSGDKSGSGKLKREFLAEQQAEAEKRQRTEAAYSMPLPLPEPTATSTPRFFC